MTTDPAVDIWAEALATLRQGRHPAPRPDRRTPFEVARDERLEDIAEERVARNRGDYATDQDADEAADRYYGDI